MRITKWGEYGILCCMHIARQSDSTRESTEKPVGAADIAATQGLPLDYTQQILHRLRKGGVIKSVRGPRGGFMLSKSPSDISLREILHAAEGATFDVICEEEAVHENCCDPQRVCALRGVWQELKGCIDELLSRHSLAALIEREKASGKVGVFERIVPGPTAASSAIPR